MAEMAVAGKILTAIIRWLLDFKNIKDEDIV